MPTTSIQIGLTAVGTVVAITLMLRSFLKKKLHLDGQVVVITGASSGIGEGTVIVCMLRLHVRFIGKLTGIL